MEDAVIERLKNSIRNIPDFPKEGILFRDISTLLKDGPVFKEAVDIIARRWQNKKIDKIAAVEARGFIFGGILAYRLNAGFIPIRKKGKLPAETYQVTYQLEYGQDTLEVHRDAFTEKDNVLIVDDLLATGGTVNAAAQLIAKTRANITAIEFLIELTDLKGREQLKGYPVNSVIKY